MFFLTIHDAFCFLWFLFLTFLIFNRVSICNQYYDTLYNEKHLFWSGTVTMKCHSFRKRIYIYQSKACIFSLCCSSFLIFNIKCYCVGISTSNTYLLFFTYMSMLSMFLSIAAKMAAQHMLPTLCLPLIVYNIIN